MEIMLISVWKTQNQNYGYNFQAGGYHGNSGTKLSEEECIKRRGWNNVKSKAVVCLNNKEIFGSLNDAARQMNICGGDEISLACQGIYQFCGKNNNGEPLIWVYYSDYINMSQCEIE